jgi:Tfp pilus assembly protein PilF
MAQMARLKEQLMRYTPVAAALALAIAVTSSVGQGAPPQPLDPRAAALIQQGRSALAAGQADVAVDDFEAALAVQPGHVAIYLNLAEATRKQGLQGKALHYYRQALSLEPDNQYAIAGEGMALVEKGAVEKARRNLTRLQQLCGKADCAPAQELAAAIDKGPPAQVAVSVADVQAAPTASPN